MCKYYLIKCPALKIIRLQYKKNLRVSPTGQSCGRSSRGCGRHQGNGTSHEAQTVAATPYQSRTNSGTYALPVMHKQWHLRPTSHAQTAAPTPYQSRTNSGTYALPVMHKHWHLRPTSHAHTVAPTPYQSRTNRGGTYALPVTHSGTYSLLSVMMR